MRTPPSRTPEKVAAYNEKLWARYGGRARYLRVCNLRNKYGITEADYDLTLDRQGGGCAICGRRECATKKALAVDHDHVTGKVRGILCGSCNRALGLMKDSPDLLAKAAEYLRRSRCRLETQSQQAQQAQPATSPEA